MHIRLPSFITIAYAAAALTGCDGPTPVDRTFSPSFARVSEPNAPSGLTATPVIPDQINLAWTDNSHNETSFQIYRSNGAAVGFSLLTTIAGNVTTYSDNALERVNAHCYYVQGMAKTRSLGVSSTVCAKPPVKPPAASNASAVAQGSVVNIAWTDNSVIESGFRVEVAPTSTGQWTASDPAVGPDVTSAQRSAALDQPVCYRVVAYNEFGDAAPSNAACTTPMGAPSLNATGEGQFDREIKLTWSTNLAADSYEISRSTSPGQWQVLTVVYVNITEYWDQSLSVGTTYSYRMRAMRGTGFSDYSNVAIATAANGRPRGPAYVYTYAFAIDAVEVYWEVPQAFWDGTSIITGWRVERSTYPFTSWTIVDPTNTHGYYDDYGLTPDETVCYQVIALSAYGESDPSSGDYSCTTPATAYYGGLSGANALGLSNQRTQFLNFGPSKSAVGRAAGVKPSKRSEAPSTKRLRRTR